MRVVKGRDESAEGGLNLRDVDGFGGRYGSSKEAQVAEKESVSEAMVST